MEYTIENYRALMSAIMTGTTYVGYGGKQVSYRSLNEMKSLARIMAKALSEPDPFPTNGGVRTVGIIDVC